MLTAEQMTSILEQVPIPIAILRVNGRSFTVLRASNAYNELAKIWDKALQHGFDDKFPISGARSDMEAFSTIQSSLAKVHSSGGEHTTSIIDFSEWGAGPRCCRFIHTPVCDHKGKLSCIIQTVKEVADQETELAEKEQEVATHRERDESIDQEARMAKKMTQYEAASEELNDFIYYVSHDLRVPLRRIDGFSQELINEHLDQLDEAGAHYLRRVRQGAQDMGNLIDDLLKLSRISRREPEFERINLSELAKTVFDDLIEPKQEKQIDLQVEAKFMGICRSGPGGRIVDQFAFERHKIQLQRISSAYNSRENQQEGGNPSFLCKITALVLIHAIPISCLRLLIACTARRSSKGRAPGWPR